MGKRPSIKKSGYALRVRSSFRGALKKLGLARYCMQEAERETIKKYRESIFVGLFFVLFLG